MKTPQQAGTALALMREQQNRAENSPLVPPVQAAEYLHVEVATLAVWRCTGRYAIPYLKVGRLVRYRQADLDAFLQARRISFTHMEEE